VSDEVRVRAAEERERRGRERRRRRRPGGRLLTVPRRRRSDGKGRNSGYRIRQPLRTLHQIIFFRSVSFVLVFFPVRFIEWYGELALVLAFRFLQEGTTLS